MSIESIFVFVSIVFAIAIVPGPNALLILHTSLSAKKLNAFVNILGISCGFFAHAIVSALGLSLLLTQSASAFVLLKWLGVGYLFWLGYGHIRESFAASKGSTAPVAKSESLHQSFIRGFLTNLLNPKIVLFYLSIFPQFVSKQTLIVDSLILGGVQALVVASWFSIVILLATHMADWLKAGKNRACLNRVSGSVYLLFGTKLAVLRL